jgi:ribosomal protein S18 acetylase RimI-like enzyme
MPEDTLRWPGGWARLGSWRGQTDVAYLAIGARRPPPAEIVQRCLGQLRGHGYQSVVTNALAPAESLPFVDAGFSVRERLHLLAHDLDEIPHATHGSRRGRASDRAGVLALDTRAFQPFWRLDDESLTSAIEATPATRYRVIEGAGRLGAYAVTGRSGRVGYLQRIAVDPDLQHRGFGRSIVADALRWLRRHRTDRALVNTQVDNEPALALYLRCGFEELPTGLCVMSRPL